MLPRLLIAEFEAALHRRKLSREDENNARNTVSVYLGHLNGEDKARAKELGKRICEFVSGGRETLTLT